VRYIIAPLDLTTEQREVYFNLYKKMDFKTFIVKYTLEQLVIDSNSILKLTKKKVSTIIKKFIKLGYLQEIKKGVKGSPTIYKVVSIKEQIGNESERIGNESERIALSNKGLADDSGTNKNELVTNRNESVTPINDKKGKEKKEYSQDELDILSLPAKEEKDTSIIDNQIIELWSLYPRKEGKQKSIKKIPKLIKKYGFEEIKRCVERYSKKCRAENIEKKYTKQGSTFFNDGYVDYLDENYVKPKIIKPVNKYGKPETIQEKNERQLQERIAKKLGEKNHDE